MVVAHVNDPAQTTLSVKQFLTTKSITVMPPHPNSPDLAQCDFFSFPTVKFCLKVPNDTLWYEVPRLFYFFCQYRDNKIWLWIMPELSYHPICHTCSIGDRFDAIRFATSLWVVPCGRPEPGLVEASPSLDPCFQQSCTVDTFWPCLSTISQKENPLSRSPVPRPNPSGKTNRKSWRVDVITVANQRIGRGRLCDFLYVDAFLWKDRRGSLIDEEIQFIQYLETPRHINYDKHGRHNTDKETTAHNTQQPVT
ncbi:hypothetical protein TNCV_1863071 [Trichonephila clavipes]|nr:hypothetical protein TNCV_1863071 [Trichonephila clavipes]